MKRVAAALVFLLAGVAPERPDVSNSGTPAAAEKRRVVWVALEEARQIVKVDVDRGDVVRRVTVAGKPHNLTVSPSGSTVAATLWAAERVVVRRRGDHRTLRLGGSPHDVKIADGRLVTANQTEARLDIVPTSRARRRSIALRSDPHDLALRWGGRQAWVSLEGSDDLAVVRIRSGRIRYVSTGRAPHDLLFAPDGKLWVTDWAGAIHVFSKKGRRLRTISLGQQAHHLDFTPDGKQAWISDQAARRIFVVSTTSYSVRKRFGVRGAPHHIAITSDGKRAVVADNARGRLVVYDVDDLRWLRTIRVGRGPHGIWSMP